MFKKQVKCSECGFLGILGGIDELGEITPQWRSDLFRYFKAASFYATCMRGQDYVIAGIPLPDEPISQETLLKNSYLIRKCLYFFRYSPGYNPNQHLELQRERTHRRFLIIVSLISASVGAGIATLVNLIWS